jgi:hypothetical protein
MVSNPPRTGRADVGVTMSTHLGPLQAFDGSAWIDKPAQVKPAQQQRQQRGECALVVQDVRFAEEGRTALVQAANLQP